MRPNSGFHLGERRMPLGKEHPYNTDVSLPFYIAGPGVPRAASLAYPTTHIDLTATIVELAGATPSRELEGLSFAPAFGAAPPTPEAWRPWQFAEHHCGQLTWRSLRWPLVNRTYSMWCGDKRPGDANGAEEVFDHGADPWELANIAADGGAGAAEAARSGPLAEALWGCTGKQCHAPAPTPVSCGRPQRTLTWDPCSLDAPAARPPPTHTPTPFPIRPRSSCSSVTRSLRGRGRATTGTPWRPRRSRAQIAAAATSSS